MKKVLISLLIIASLVTCGVIYYEKNYDSNLVKVDDIKTDPKFEKVEYKSNESIDENILGILEIDKINLKAAVKEGSTSNVLKEYIGHIEQTPNYEGNTGLAAHNRGYEQSYFARLNELKVGDIVKYKTKFYERKYKVESIKSVFETDLSILDNTNVNMLTMVTCITNKRNQRLCVKAIEI